MFIGILPKDLSVRTFRIRLGITLQYCMKRYILDDEVEDYHYALAKKFYCDAAEGAEQAAAAYAARAAVHDDPEN